MHHDAFEVESGGEEDDGSTPTSSVSGSDLELANALVQRFYQSVAAFSSKRRLSPVTATTCLGLAFASLRQAQDRHTSGDAGSVTVDDDSNLFAEYLYAGHAVDEPDVLFVVVDDEDWCSRGV
jgi:hypothetical protein